MKLTDLSVLEKWFLHFSFENPDFKFIGTDLTVINVLASYNLVKYAGNHKFELTKEGKDLLDEILVEETSVEITPIKIGQSITPVV